MRQQAIAQAQAARRPAPRQLLVRPQQLIITVPTEEPTLPPKVGAFMPNCSRHQPKEVAKEDTELSELCGKSQPVEPYQAPPSSP